MTASLTLLSVIITYYSKNHIWKYLKLLAYSILDSEAVKLLETIGKDMQS